MTRKPGILFAHYLQPREKQNKPSRALTELLPHDPAFPRVCTHPARRNHCTARKSFLATDQIIRETFLPSRRDHPTGFISTGRTAPHPAAASLSAPRGAPRTANRASHRASQPRVEPAEGLLTSAAAIKGLHLPPPHPCCSPKIKTGGFWLCCLFFFSFPSKATFRELPGGNAGLPSLTSRIW